MVKLTHWEHWPTMAFYLPLLPAFALRSIKAGHPIFYTSTNPGILFSGNGTESKFHTLNLIEEQWRPKGILIEKGAALDDLSDKLKQAEIDFPLIVKPDVGFRGYLVKRLDTMESLIKYVQAVDESIIIQEFIPYKKELGIFYHRDPEKNKGKISSVTIKKFIQLIGDGHSTLEELIKEDTRARLYLDLFKTMHKDNWNIVHPEGRKIELTAIGNHSKGTQFLNGNHLITNELHRFMDSVCSSIDGWNYGRLDIKYDNWEDLLQGKNFKVLEVNGIISEPTHIYDATHKEASFFKALLAINQHWNIMADIAVKNHDQYGVAYAKVIPYLKNMLWLRSYSKKLKRLNKVEF